LRSDRIWVEYDGSATCRIVAVNSHRRKIARGAIALALFPFAHLAAGADADADGKELRNWFDDPFFVVRSAVAGCPLPLGPLTTGDEMRTQTHNRSERGTRCWQEGRCSRPNSFLYDNDIAAAVRARFAQSKDYRDTSLWVTVQRRIVWVEGCVKPTYRSGQLEQMIRSVTDVELVIVNVRKREGDPVPYRVYPTPPR
jgi:hypothetical protein